jgi:ZIP family zinc transporter
MLYVVSDELIPESHSHGFEHQATFGFIAGFMLLLALTQILW